MTGTTVAAAQLRLAVGDVEANRAAAVGAAVAAAAAGADLLVLPELCDTGYVFASLDEARSLADPATTLGGWVEAAEQLGLVIVGGFCDTDRARLFNAAAVVDGSGVRAVYHKAHLWGEEPDTFAAGCEAPPVVETTAGRVGVVVCYDLEFPEWVRRVAEAGAETLAVPVNWPLFPRPAGERPVEVIKAQAAAATNGVHLVVADRAGEERGQSWTGGSVIVGCDGYPLAGPVLADESALLVATLDPTEARDKRIGDRNDLLADRRPDLYLPSPGEMPAPSDD